MLSLTIEFFTELSALIRQHWVISALPVLYFLYVVFVFIYVAALQEFKTDSWHYWIWRQMFGDDKRVPEPKTSCEYGTMLIVYPPAFLIMHVVMIVEFIFMGLIFPWFSGKWPTKKGWEDLYNLNYDAYHPVEKREFCKFPPILVPVAIALMALLIYGLIYISRWVRVLFNHVHVPTHLTAVILFKLLVTMVIIGLLVQFLRDPETPRKIRARSAQVKTVLKDAWNMARNRVCHPLRPQLADNKIISFKKF